MMGVRPIPAAAPEIVAAAELDQRHRALGAEEEALRTREGEVAARWVHSRRQALQRAEALRAEGRARRQEAREQRRAARREQRGAAGAGASAAARQGGEEDGGGSEGLAGGVRGTKRLLGATAPADLAEAAPGAGGGDDDDAAPAKRAKPSGATETGGAAEQCTVSVRSSGAIQLPLPPQDRSAMASEDKQQQEGEGAVDEPNRSPSSEAQRAATAIPTGIPTVATNVGVSLSAPSGAGRSLGPDDDGAPTQQEDQDGGGDPDASSSSSSCSSSSSDDEDDGPADHEESFMGQRELDYPHEGGGVGAVSTLRTSAHTVSHEVLLVVVDLLMVSERPVDSPRPTYPPARPFARRHSCHHSPLQCGGRCPAR
jgi:hypothetical protein